VPTIAYTSVPLTVNGGVAANKATIQTKMVAASAAGYCNKQLPSVLYHSNQKLCDGGSNSNVGQRFTVTFYEPVGDAAWRFKINMDSGFGYAVLGDGASIGKMEQDVWADGTNPKTYTLSSVGTGPHTFEVYGGEGCCDEEAGAWQFQRNDGAWQTLTTANLNSEQSRCLLCRV
jgi:hypothetical protein